MLMTSSNSSHNNVLERDLTETGDKEDSTSLLLKFLVSYINLTAGEEGVKQASTPVKIVFTVMWYCEVQPN